jgi:hypothetical protein
LDSAACRAYGVGVLLIVEFEVGFGGFGELVADEDAADPALREVLVAEVIADLAIYANGADAGVGLEGKKEVGAGVYDSSGHAPGGIFEAELRVGGEAEVDDGFRGGLGLGLALGFCGLGGAEPVVAGMVLVEAPFDAHEAVAETDEDGAGLSGIFGSCG